ncbi:MAG: hypothetical protein R3C61_27420 [Bacteroidia bacterium]
MKKLFICLIGFCTHYSSLANPGADSLLVAFHQAEGMDKQVILLQLGAFYAADSFDLALGFITEAKNMAEEKGEQRHLAYACMAEGNLWEQYAEFASDNRKALQPFLQAKFPRLHDAVCLAQSSFAIARLYAV